VILLGIVGDIVVWGVGVVGVVVLGYCCGVVLTAGGWLLIGLVIMV
jgi:hypothetical protein